MLGTAILHKSSELESFRPARIDVLQGFPPELRPGFMKSRGKAYDPSRILREALSKRGRVTPPEPRGAEIGGEDGSTTPAPLRIDDLEKKTSKATSTVPRLDSEVINNENGCVQKVFQQV